MSIFGIINKIVDIMLAEAPPNKTMKHTFVRVVSYSGPGVDCNIDMIRKKGYYPLGQILKQKIGNDEKFKDLFSLELRLEEKIMKLEKNKQELFRINLSTLSTRETIIWEYTKNEAIKLQFQIYKSEV